MTTMPPKDGRPACTVVTLPDPDSLPVSHDAEKGGTIEWRTETHHYPEFEIHFKGANPFSDEQDLVVVGSDMQPVVMRLKNIGSYQYMIKFKKTDGTCKDVGPRFFNIRVCNGCPDDPGGGQ